MVDNGNFDFAVAVAAAAACRSAAVTLCLVLSACVVVSIAIFRSATVGGIGLHARWVTVTCGCGRTIASFGAAETVRLVRQVPAAVDVGVGVGIGGRRRVVVVMIVAMDDVEGAAGKSIAIAAIVSEEAEAGNFGAGL